jgi:hypothetical protein
MERSLWREEGSVAAGPRQRSHSRVRVRWDSQIWEFPFCHLLRLAGLRWRYSTPPPHGIDVNSHSHILSYLLGTDHTQKTQLYCCVAQKTQKTSHLINISPVHWLTDCCLATSHKYLSYCCVTLSEVFIAPLPSYACYNINSVINFFWRYPLPNFYIKRRFRE